MALGRYAAGDAYSLGQSMIRIIFFSVWILLWGCGSGSCGQTEGQVSATGRSKIPEPYVKLDFTDRFPYKYWISDWSKDSSYPMGFRYKLLTSRTKSTGMFDMVLVLEEPGGLKTEMEHLKLSIKAIDRTCTIFVDGLSEEHGLDFQMIDLSGVMTFEAFDKEVTAHGWHEWKP